jgi:hypothetical protein
MSNCYGKKYVMAKNKFDQEKKIQSMDKDLFSCHILKQPFYASFWRSSSSMIIDTLPDWNAVQISENIHYFQNKSA